jgi:hypothetical protein
MDKIKIEPEAIVSEPEEVVEEDVKEVVKEDIEPGTKRPTHRYVCDACTNQAGASAHPFEVVSIICISCGKEQECKKENWIKI